MKSNPRIALSLFLIIVGIWYLLIELFPIVGAFAYGKYTWPIQIIGVGILLFVLALLFWTPGMMIPASIVSGIGGLLYWQNISNNWASWTYAWAFIIIFVGIGIGLVGLMNRSRGTLIGAGWTILIGAIQFVIFGAFLGGLDQVRKLWPVTLVLLGLVLLLQGMIKRKRLN